MSEHIETWWEARGTREQIEGKIARIAREIAGPTLDQHAGNGVAAALGRADVEIDGVRYAAGAHLESVLDHADVGARLLVLREHSAAYSRDPAYHSALAYLRTRRERRAAREAWADLVRRIVERADVLVGRVRLLAAQVAGDVPVLDSGGRTLTGDAAYAERLRLYSGDLCDEYTRFFNHHTLTIYLLSGGGVGTESRDGAISPLLDQARVQWLERIDDAARVHLAYLLDCEDPAYARPIGSEQRTAAELLERRRQDARRNVRRVTTVQRLRTAAEGGIALIEAVPVEHSPEWRDSAGRSLVITSGRLHATWTAPATGQWRLDLQTLRTGERRGVITPPIVLDVSGRPSGWTVTRGTRHAGDYATWPVFVQAPLAPAPGVYDMEIVARDDLGPGRLRVRVTVPAPASP